MSEVGAVTVAPPPAPPIPAVKLEGIFAGLDRSALLAHMGAHYRCLLIQDDGGVVEILTYTLDGNCSAKVRLENGRAVSIQKYG